jgi:hypothetical protein
VELVHWKDPEGRSWSGRLYYPVGYRVGGRYALVVQPYGFAPATEFSIYGSGGMTPRLGPGWATYLAQQLANRDIVVLQMGNPDNWRAPVVDRAAALNNVLTAGREAAIEHFVAAGLVDRDRVGMQAFSQMGRYLEHTLAFSDFPYAAAIAADHADNNYLQSILMFGGLPDNPELQPYGEGLKVYLEGSPAFNAERIRTPLQIQVYGPGVSSLVPTGWEMFTRLRHLKKPVELYAIPDIEHGVHTLQNPRQLMAAQQRALDWWCFWLNGEEDDEPAKAEQYAQWRKLRELHDADMKRPRPSLLKWTATPASTSR